MGKIGEAFWAVLKSVVAWLGIAIGHAVTSITLSGVVLVLTGAFTASQLYWGWRKYLREAEEQ